MADFKDAIKSGLEEYLDGLKKAVDGLTSAELRWQPTLASNSPLYRTSDKHPHLFVGMAVFIHYHSRVDFKVGPHHL